MSADATTPANDCVKVEAEAHVDAFLRDAARLTLEQWQTVCSRYFDDPKVRRAGRTISGVALEALLARQKAHAPGQQPPPDPFLDDCATRIKAIGGAFPGEWLFPEHGADRRQAVNVLLGIAKSALLYRRDLLADPSKARAVRRFLSIFDGVIDLEAIVASGSDGAA